MYQLTDFESDLGYTSRSISQDSKAMERKAQINKINEDEAFFAPLYEAQKRVYLENIELAKKGIIV